MRWVELRAAMAGADVTPEARAVWWAIASHANREDKAWPPRQVIARMAGMSVRSVSKYLRELEEAGLLITTRPDGGRNTYLLQTVAAPAANSCRTSAANTNSVTSTNGNAKSTRKDAYKGVPVSKLCTACRAPVVFADLPTGRTVCLNTEPDDTGLYALLDGDRVTLLTFEQRDKATPEVRGRLRRLHDDTCDGFAAIGNVDNRRVNRYRERIRADKLRRERNR